MAESNYFSCDASSQDYVFSSFWSREFHRIERHLVHVEIQLKKSDDLHTMLQVTSDLLHQLDRLRSSLLTAENGDFFQMKKANDLRAHAIYLINQIKVKMDLIKRSRPATVPLGVLVQIEEQQPATKKPVDSGNFPKDVVCYLMKNVTSMFSKLMRLWQPPPASILPLYYNQKM